MSIAYVDPLSRAFGRMKQILFSPFDLVKWLVIGFSAWLAQLVSGPGNGGGSWNLGDVNEPSDLFRAPGDAWETLVDHAVWVPVILAIVVVLVALLLLLVWLSSRGKFIFLDNVVHDRAQIVVPWKRFRDAGNSLFLWRVGFGLACLAVALLILFVIVGPAAAMSLHDAFSGLSFAAIFVGVLLMVAFGVIAAYVSLFLDSFIVPIMYRFNLSATAAWRAFLPWLSARGGWLFLYGLFVLLLGICVVFIFALVCLFTCCIAALPYIGTVIMLPAWVTYRAFSLEFLAQLDPGFDLFAAAAEAPQGEALEGE